MSGWADKHLNFDHDKDAKYQLEGKHADLECVECHKPKSKDAKLSSAQFRNMKYKVCDNCHDDPHKKNFGDDCEYCHTYSEWKRKK
jgi:hypothetical protein